VLLRRTITFLAGIGLLLGPFSQRAGAPSLAEPAWAGPQVVAPVIVPEVHRSLPRWRGGRLDAVAVKAALRVYPRPGSASGALQRVSARNPWGQAIRFLVVGAARGSGGGEPWFRVLLGIDHNGAAGWVPMHEIHLRRTQDRIVVSLSRRTLWHMRDGRLLQRYRVAVGATNTPTTPGRFFVWAKLPANPHGAYGSYILGLSGFSDVLTYWPGGGRMAIHGTDNPNDRGKWVSHGCVRVYNPQMDTLRDVPMGTPVIIRY
jgi:lipoprotein-anchoring transpeptidase ErfK/SrfK